MRSNVCKVTRMHVLFEERGTGGVTGREGEGKEKGIRRASGETKTIGLRVPGGLRIKIRINTMGLHVPV